MREQRWEPCTSCGRKPPALGTPTDVDAQFILGRISGELPNWPISAFVASLYCHECGLRIDPRRRFYQQKGQR